MGYVEKGVFSAPFWGRRKSPRIDCTNYAKNSHQFVRLRKPCAPDSWVADGVGQDPVKPEGEVISPSESRFYKRSKVLSVGTGVRTLRGEEQTRPMEARGSEDV